MNSLVIKILGSNLPEYLRVKLHFLSETHQVNTRFKNKLAIEPQKYKLFRSSFTYQTAAVFNKFLTNAVIKNKETLKSIAINQLSD